ncbi:NAD-dependent methanol dehydrogenase [Roseobacter fucihabitans]|uniref:NAD-dependent methanol dehydrogenase n=1 Tax=Roseobacter fucihabitans TaxID=1537242 RepID=A0ABZ2BT63_9RHOB|nr:NAD-dependent methanol dehydrogenase [Roseobacter litoralis]
MGFDFLSPGRIAFGRGARAQTAQQTRAFGQNVMLLRGSSVAWVDTLERDLRDRGCVVSTVLSSGEPSVAEVQNAVQKGRNAGIEVVLAVGGGAVIDLGKAVAALMPAPGDIMDHLEGVGAGKPLVVDPVPLIALPTTSGTGAEVTKNAVITVPDAGRKVSLRDDRMLARLAIIDPALTDQMARGQTLASGLDALTQVIEPYLSSRANPLTDAICRSAIPQGVTALAQLAQGEDPTARDQMAFVSLSGGLALANAGLGAVHGLAGVLGGRLGAPHGLICGRLLGPILAANAAKMREMDADLARFDEVARWLGQGFDREADVVFDALPAILDSWQVPRLDQWVRGDVDLEAIALEAASASSMKSNPCGLSVPALVHAMQRAL